MLLMTFNENGFTYRIFIILHSIAMHIHLEIYWLSRYISSTSQKESHLFQKYLNILSAGGSQKPEYLLKESGIDISKDEFWQQGFDLVAAKIQELKKMN